MKTKSAWGAFAGLAVSLASPTVTATDGVWMTTGDGVYTNGVNWWSAGVFPGASSSAFFDISSAAPASGEFTVTFDGAVTDYNKTCVRSVTPGVPLVFAVTNGASWYKGPGCFYDSYHTMGFGLCEGGGQTCDNLSIRPSSCNTTQPCFRMSDALLSYTVNATGNRISFSKGTWNWYDPSGSEADSPANTMYVGYGRNEEVQVTDGLTFTVAADATLRGRHLTVASHTMEIAGGDHTLAGVLAIGQHQTKSSALRIRGGSLTTKYLNLGVPTRTLRTADDTGFDALVLSGTAAVTNQSTMCVQNACNAAARIELRDTSELVSKGAYVGNGSDNTRPGVLAHVLVTNSATFKTLEGTRFGNTGNALVEVADHGTYRHAVNNGFYIGHNAPGALWVKDDAKAVFSSPIMMVADNANAEGEIIVSGRGSLSWADPESGGAGNGYSVTFGNETAKRIYLGLRDEATFTTRSDTLFKMYGTNTLAELSGGTAAFNNQIQNFGGSAGDCRLRVSGGSHTLSSASFFGHSTGGTKAVFEQSGGTWTCGAPVIVYFAGTQASTATGRCELTGGVFLGKVNGGPGATIRGGKGRAEFYANGGTVGTLAAAGDPYVGYFDEAVLGEKGLTFDSGIGTGDPRADIKQAFADEAGKSGLFVKTGAGIANFYNASAHGRTVIAGGTAYFKAGLSQFGRALTVTNNATLDVAESISAERLSLGDAATAGTLKLAAGAVVTLTGDDAFGAANAVLDYAPAATKGTYTIFRLTGTVNRTAFLPLALVQSSATLHFAFQFAADGGDTLVQLVTYEDADVTPANWQGTTGVYETPGNWKEGAAPGVTGSAVFPAEASVRDVTVTGLTTVDNMVFGGGSYAIRGNGPLKSFGFSVTAGEVDVLAPVLAYGSLALDLEAGTELTLSGAIAGRFAAEKTGKGLLTLASSSTAESDWTLSGGKTEIANLGALGAGVLTVGHATARFTDAGETAGGLAVASGSGQAAVLDVSADVTFDGGFTTTSGGTLKTGANRLTVNFPAGTYQLAKDDLGLGRNALPGNATAFINAVPADGETADVDGVAGFTVREGAVRLTGAGRDVTTVRQDHWTLVGGKWTNDVAEAELELANLTFENHDTEYRRVFVGYSTYGTCLNPKLRVLDGALFKTQGLLVGCDFGAETHRRPTFEITNAAARIGTCLYVGSPGRWEPHNHSTVRILAGADVLLDGIHSTEFGLMIGGNAEVLIDGGTLRTSTSNAGVLLYNTSSGSVCVRNGGALRVTGFLSKDTSEHVATTNFFLTVDGGTLELLASGDVPVSDPHKRQVVMGENGGTLCVDGDLRYVFRFPIKGSGALVKTGLGELVIGTGRAAGGVASGLETAQWTGPTTVSAGTLTFEETTSVAARTFSVAAGATLDLGGYAGDLPAVSGAGKIRNATVGNLTIRAARPDATPVMTELDVTLGGPVTVDFGVPEGESAARPLSPVAVAKLGSGATFVAGNWRAVNRGVGNRVSFSCTDGIVWATFGKPLGFRVIVR